MSKSLPSPERLAYAEALVQAGFAQAGKCQMDVKFQNPKYLSFEL